MLSTLGVDEQPDLDVCSDQDLVVRLKEPMISVREGIERLTSAHEWEDLRGWEGEAVIRSINEFVK